MEGALDGQGKELWFAADREPASAKWSQAANDRTLPIACREIGIPEWAFHDSRKEHDVLKVSHAKRRKDGLVLAEG